VKVFDLTTREGRYHARRAGLDVPMRKRGRKPKAFDSLIQRGEGCWLWVGGKNRDGYGTYYVDGLRKMAHRHAWELVNGPIPSGMVLLHECDQPACCNPAHLRVGTHAENIADKVQKSRQAKGERTAQSVLTTEQVLEMRRLYKFRVVTYKMLAVQFGVCKDTVQKAIRGINWGHL
jgi:hypothetical protein